MVIRWSTASDAARALGVAFSLVLVLVTRTASPQNDAAAAQALFDEARALMARGRYAAACPKLAESQRLDPGGGTLLNLALCHEKQGLTASAWSEFKEALGVARRDRRADRIRLAEKHIGLLEPRLARLTVVVPEAARLRGLRIARDGVRLRSALWGTALPVDPGDHVVVASAPGHDDKKLTVTVRAAGARHEVVIPALAPAAPSGQGNDEQRVAGFAVGGVGIVAMIVGAVFGGLAIAKDGEADEICADPLRCGCQGETCRGPEAQRAAELSDEARLDAKLANGFLFGGLGCAALGAVLVLTADLGGGDEVGHASPDLVLVPWLSTRGAGGVLERTW
jgi:hypothetical protein